ncbi:MAG: hypothetical protein DSM106950_36290 [Stigonema ocellatum SAG 48.90 = DSM 106950]|nr:hypothetical protein [Stigonema ocellatum SAG 48.90 = DSM 106950]
MVISAQLMEDLVKVLTPLMDTPNNREGYVLRALGTGSRVSNRLAWDGSANEFIPKLVKELANFKKLCALLEVIREEVGEDVKKLINRLLQQIIQQQLTDILAPLEQKQEIFQVMKKAYVECCPRNWGEDWEDESPDTLEKILSNLGDMPQGNAHESPIVQFVARLSQNPNISEPTATQLKEWVQQNAKNFSQLLTEISDDEVTTKEQQDSIPTYLIILIKPSQQNQNKHYSVAAWFISDGRKDKFDFRTGQGYNSLDIQEQEEIFQLKQIPTLVQNFLTQAANKYMMDWCEPPIIMFFLPFKLLNEPIDSWKIEKIPLGIQYHVVIRSCGRLKGYLFRNIWIQKWQALQHRMDSLDEKNLIFGDGDWKSLLNKLDQPKVVGVKLLKPPSKDIINVLEKTATPVAIWFRKSLKEINLQEQFETLVKGGMGALPKIIKEKRSEAFSIDKEQHIGHHISLLWEDPYLLPIETSQFKMPT